MPLRPPETRTLSNRTIGLCATALLGFVIGICWLLLWLYGHGTDADKARLDGIRTVGGIVVGAGGAVALLLAARRQQTAEHDLATKRHDLLLRERANDDARHDAEERRITDLYLKAVEQLGSDKAPVRLAGLYALERLAQDNPPHRQTIVNVVSAYLRMPYDLPGATFEEEQQSQDERRRGLQEREVRVTAQRILTDHLAPGDGDGKRLWPDMDLDLSGAVLVDFTLLDCELDGARFADTSFTGETHFLGVRFSGSTRFDGACFMGTAWFAQAEFAGSVRFDRAGFSGDARFDEASFIGDSSFRSAKFDQDARFDRAAFRGCAIFIGVGFVRKAIFAGASFMEQPWVGGTRFGSDAVFTESVLAKESWFSKVSFSRHADFGDATFVGDILFDGATLDGNPYEPEELNPRPNFID